MTSVTLDMDTGLPSNSVKCISRDSNGYYYFGTTAGLVYAEYDNGDVRILKVDTEAGNVKDFSPSSDGYMIVRNNLGEISCYDHGEKIAQLKLSGVTPTGVKHDKQDNLYIGTDDGTILIYTFYGNRFHAIS